MIRYSLVMLGAAVAFTSGISGCTQRNANVNWQHPTLPKEEWAADFGECRRYARREMEREAGLPAMGAPSDNISGGTSSFNSSMSKYRLQKYQDKAFADCMRRLGYVPISK
ncbi:MAG: hypothetical protein JJ855_12185 [Rhodospirillales bacterium]|nr:hypothetical protein [Rhodospirillales bacterium]